MELYNRDNQKSQNLEELCLMLLRDDPNLTTFYPKLDIPGWHVFQIDDVDAGRLGIALIGNTHLKTLVLTLDTNLTARGARMLASGIRQSQITALELHNNSFADSHLISILYEEGVQLSPSLRELKVEDDIGSFTALCKTFSKLEKLVLSNCELSPGIQLISDALIDSNGPTLKHLQLNYGGMTGDDMRILSAGLFRNSSLKILDLNNNVVDDEGIVSFVEQWREDSPLEELALGTNLFGIDGALALLDAIPGHDSLTRLDIGVKEYGFSGIQRIAERIPRIRLKELDISCCATGINGLRFEDLPPQGAFRKAAKIAAESVLRGIQQNLYVTKLDTRENCFPIDIQNEINLYVELNKCGRHLLGEDDIPAGLWSHVFEICGNRESVIYFILREQPHLMVGAAQRERRTRPCANNSTYWMLRFTASKVKNMIFAQYWETATQWIRQMFAQAASPWWYFFRKNKQLELKKDMES